MWLKISCLAFFFLNQMTLACTPQKDAKDTRYAQKQYFLGSDYFDKYVESLRKVESLQIENLKTEQEIANGLQAQPDEQALMEIRLKKQRIQKNSEQIREESELSQRYLNAALEELKKSLVADPANAGTHFLLGLIYLKKATSELDISTRMQCMTGESLEEHTQQANSLLTLARRHFVRASSDKQMTSKCQNNIAAIDIHFGQHENAIMAARMALKDLVYQDGHVARSNMGWAYFHLKKYELALSQLTQALLMEGKFCVARYRLGRVYMEQNRTEDAVSEFERVLRQGHPCNSIQEVYLYLGLGYVKLERPDEARTRFQTCIEVAPESCVSQECKNYLKLLEGDQES